MVKEKTIWILIVISILMLAASFLISTFSQSKEIKLSSSEDLGGNSQANVGLVINPPATANAAGVTG